MSITDDPNDPDLGRGLDNEPAGQNRKYLVLSEQERKDGFVRPLRETYVHETCGSRTTMALAIAQTYAKNPSFYGATYCVGCRMHRPVGVNGEFVWLDGEKVGS